jgi:hypothetical protein
MPYIIFAELVSKYFQKSGIDINNKPYFLFNGQSIDCDSYKTLSELDINDGAVIITGIAKPIEDTISVRFCQEDNQKIIIKAKPDMMFAELVLKYMQESGIDINKKTFFLINGQSINCDSCKTLSELHINDGAIIITGIAKPIEDEISIRFCQEDDQKIIIKAKPDMTFAELVSKYMQESRIDINKKPYFLFNGQSINCDSCKTLSELHITDKSSIVAYNSNS